MANATSLLNSTAKSSSPQLPDLSPSLSMGEEDPQLNRKSSIPSPGLDALAAAAETSARLVSPILNSPPSFPTTFVGGYGSTAHITSGLDQLGDAAASVRAENESLSHTQTAQLKEPMPGPEQDLPREIVPGTQDEQVQVKTEISEPIPAELQQESNSQANLPLEHKNTVIDEIKPSLPSKPSPKPKAPPKKRAPPKKGTASTVKVPANKKRKLDHPDSAGGTPLPGTPTSRASGTPVPRGSKKNAASETPTRSSSVAIPSDDIAASDSESNEVFCICRKPDDHGVMIGCDGPCEDWFHLKCVNMTQQRTKLVQKWFCPPCSEQGHQTLWRRMCRLPGCEEPSRQDDNGKHVSKYCSDEHGEEFMRRLAFPHGATNFDDYTKPPASSGTRKKSLIAQQLIKDERAGSEAAEETESRGGVLKTGELKALVDFAGDVTSFHRLGEGIPSPPPTANGDAPSSSFANQNLQFTPDEETEIANIAEQKAALEKRRDMLLDRDKFVQMVEARHKSVWATMKERGETGKDICGYDSRLTWSDEEFTIWRQHKEGKSILEKGELGPPGTEPRLLAHERLPNGVTPPEDTELPDAEDGDEEEEIGKGVCKKKRCERHRAWFKNQMADNNFEKNKIRDAVRKLEEREKSVRDGVLLRGLEGEGSTAGDSAEAENNGTGRAEDEMNGVVHG